MDPNTILDVFAGLDLPVMASLAVLSGILRITPLPRWSCILVPMVLGGVWGYFVTLDAVDAVAGSYAKYFSAILLNSMGGVVAGRLAGPAIQKLFTDES